ncbi:hypothetical protein C8N30_3178 [Sulfitobacter guttiformis]|uniref:Uncharacterized protein n=1 Tax=Sulfitobacter guttiformis TaxID=74349 RepID=A0A420DIM0_9RHOB|nr:hypothetical protein C8N30_3178 [Sulfitobacter guttiformis]
MMIFLTALATATLLAARKAMTPQKQTVPVRKTK